LLPAKLFAPRTVGSKAVARRKNFIDQVRVFLARTWTQLIYRSDIRKGPVSWGCITPEHRTCTNISVVRRHPGGAVSKRSWWSIIFGRLWIRDRTRQVWVVAPLRMRLLWAPTAYLPKHLVIPRLVISQETVCTPCYWENLHWNSKKHLWGSTGRWACRPGWLPDGSIADDWRFTSQEVPTIMPGCG
jgi:hypothetical protein